MMETQIENIAPETIISEGTLIHTYNMNPPPREADGNCADCGYSGEFIFSIHAHYGSCEWANDPNGVYRYHQIHAAAPDTPEVRAAVKATPTARVCRTAKPQAE